jgi:hypothetical protein
VAERRDIRVVGKQDCNWSVAERRDIRVVGKQDCNWSVAERRDIRVVGKQDCKWLVAERRDIRVVGKQDCKWSVAERRDIRVVLQSVIKCNFHCMFQQLYKATYIHEVKQSLTDLDRPLAFHEVEAHRFIDNQHMKVVRLSALHTGSLYPPGNTPGTHFC